ncbi:hypothetical protein ACFQ7A_06975 [Streptomyces sp. NPDC056528]|uniref:hypothetical protein n=1 Tax=Streptomyces sp. NPDC056528 TaxID=3345854 RepID=UPI003677CB4D
MRKALVSMSAAALLLGVLTATPAAAATQEAEDVYFCGGTYDRFYLYENESMSGGCRYFTGSDWDFAGDNWYGTTVRMNNSASSMRNRSSSSIRLWEVLGYYGNDYTAQPNSSDSSFANNGFNDTASSLQWL